jgi:cytochrome c553
MNASKSSVKQPILAALAATCLWFPLSGVQAADTEAGKQKAAEACASCHGPEGRQSTAPTYPVLAGQHRDYLLHALKAYKSGARDNALMASIVSGLSERDMENLAAWFASREGLRDLRIK